MVVGGGVVVVGAAVVVTESGEVGAFVVCVGVVGHVLGDAWFGHAEPVRIYILH